MQYNDNGHGIKCGLWLKHRRPKGGECASCTLCHGMAGGMKEKTHNRATCPWNTEKQNGQIDLTDDDDGGKTDGATKTATKTGAAKTKAAAAGAQKQMTGGMTQEQAMAQAKVQCAEVERTATAGAAAARNATAKDKEQAKEIDALKERVTKLEALTSTLSVTVMQNQMQMQTEINALKSALQPLPYAALPASSPSPVIPFNPFAPPKP